VIIVAVSLVLSSFIFLSLQANYPNKPDNISFADIGSDPLAALVHVAQDQNLFSKNGINLTITNYVTGPNTINATLYGKTDFGTSLEYAFVANSALKDGNLSIVATVDKSQMVFIIARKDSGIQNIGDLEAKKIGLTQQMSSIFYLGRFLELHDLSIANVTLVNLAASEYVNALVNGTVDAFVAGASYIQQAADQLPNNTVVWSVQSDQVTYSLVFCRNDWITQHPELLQRFLKSLSQAENFVVNHPVDAKSNIQKDYNATNAYMNQIWGNHQFSLSLDQSLVSAMEEDARWMISNNLTNQSVVPDFTKYIYFDGLNSVKPESVNIIH
jgi:ABC-type nitrate/sulfonate/bicarbonate transport system substrate-binding protein